MKALGCFVVVMAVAFAGFFALVGWSITRGDDQSALTSEVEGVAIEPREFGSGLNSDWHFDYAYEVDRRWYGYDLGRAGNRYWSPGDPVRLCVNPDAPEQHVQPLNANDCGEERAGLNSIKEATPRPAP